MSNPSPEPSAESLKTATEMHDRECPCLDDAVPPEPNADCVRLIWEFAMALDAAKRSSRREALGQAADVVGGMKQRRMRAEILRGLDDTEDADGWGPLTLSELALMKGVESALRALMEAE